MGIIIEKEIRTSKKYDVYAVNKWCMSYGDTLRIRLGLNSKCLLCEKPFVDTDIPMVAFIRASKNKFVCEECGNMIQYSLIKQELEEN